MLCNLDVEGYIRTKVRDEHKGEFLVHQVRRQFGE
jgi:hypothetical protein